MNNILNGEIKNTNTSLDQKGISIADICIKLLQIEGALVKFWMEFSAWGILTKDLNLRWMERS